MDPWDQRLARRLVRPLAGTPLHPNHLTTVTAVLGLLAAGLFATGDPTAAAWAAGVYMLAVFSDHLDGELARMTGKTSEFGHRYDYIVGGVNYTLLFIGIGVGLWRAGAGDWALALGLAAGLSNPMVLALRMTMDRRFGAEAVRHPSRSGFEIEDFIYLIGPITWLAGLKWFFVPYGLGTLGYLAWTVLEFLRWRRRAQAGGAAP